MKKVYLPSKEGSAPLSGAYKVGELIFVSGQIHADKEWNIIGDTIEEKFKIVINNIKDILAEAGLTLSDIIKLNIFLTDLDELPELNEIYKKYFDHPLPARTAIGVKALPLGATLEIEVVAAIKS